MVSETTHHKPEDEFSPALLVLTFLVGGFFFHVLNSLKIDGRENIPRSGAVILAANHSSYLDPVLIGLSVVGIRRVYYLAWKALFRRPFHARIIRGLGAVELDSESGVDRRAYRMARELLREGQMVCIYPEGGRNDGVTLRPFKAGTARLAMATGSPILPVRIEGSGKGWQKGRKWPRIFVAYRVTIMPSIVPEGEGREAEKELMKKLRAAIEG